MRQQLQQFRVWTNLGIIQKGTLGVAAKKMEANKFFKIENSYISHLYSDGISIWWDYLISNHRNQKLQAVVSQY